MISCRAAVGRGAMIAVKVSASRCSTISLMSTLRDYPDIDADEMSVAFIFDPS
jgi:hypothetical protein